MPCKQCICPCSCIDAAEWLPLPAEHARLNSTPRDSYPRALDVTLTTVSQPLVRMSSNPNRRVQPLRRH
jgi:hypothetical protein